MNLHISAPSVFIDSFYKNLVKIGLEKNNKIILRSATESTQFPSAKLYSSQFKKLVGDTNQYEKVFIHQFSPLMYRWVALNDFNELNWMVWGADLYNLPGLEDQFYEPLTRSYVKSTWNIDELLYKTKLLVTSTWFKKEAYGKIDNLLTWMDGEFSFAKEKLPITKTNHKFFYYENTTPYHQLIDRSVVNPDNKTNRLPVFILGNSGAKTNNHLDTLHFFSKHSIAAKLIIPVSYGDKKYISFLKAKAALLKNIQVEFMDSFLSFQDYSAFLKSTDALIMNTTRPQGYGNIFMMLCLGKPVYMNTKNISLDDLAKQEIHWKPMQDLLSPTIEPMRSSAEAVLKLLSHERLIDTYTELFS